jgi:uncharacterized protein (TIGR03067 family)
MRTAILAAVALGLTALPAQDAAAKKDLAALQGTWTLVAMEVEGKAVEADKLRGTTLTIKDNKYTLVSRQQQHEVEITLDAAAKPKAIDMKFLDGPNKDRVGKGVYTIEGNTLKICRHLDPQDPRPEGFATKDKIGRFVMVWEREK